MKLTHLAVLSMLPLAACASKPPPPPPAPPLPAYSAQDQLFVTMAANSDSFEIQSSKMALQKTRNPRDRRFAQRMIDDHTKTTQKLTAIAQQKGMIVPTQLDQTMQQNLNVLQAAGRPTFDREYANQQIQGHQMMLQNLQTEISTGMDPDLKTFAQNTLPIVQSHLTMAQALPHR